MIKIIAIVGTLIFIDGLESLGVFDEPRNEVCYFNIVDEARQYKCVTVKNK